MRRTIALLALLALAIPFFGLVPGCARQPTSTAVGTLRLKMTDAPGDFDSVNVVVTEVSAHIAGSDGTAGAWEVLTDGPARYDLLSLRNGVFATLAIAQVPAGQYTQIRMQLGDGSNVVENGVSYPLVIPSDMRSGYKMVGEFDIPAGGLLDLELDFDAARSIVRTGAGAFQLEPTIRVRPYGTSGTIRGSVAPGDVAVDVFAILGSDTIATTSARNGGFQLSVLPAGTYTVAFLPEAGFHDAMRADVAVTAGTTAELGTIKLNPAE